MNPVSYFLMIHAHVLAWTCLLGSLTGFIKPLRRIVTHGFIHMAGFTILVKSASDPLKALNFPMQIFFAIKMTRLTFMKYPTAEVATLYHKENLHKIIGAA